MVAMATATTVPVEAYLRSSYEPDAEYVDGVIEERPAGELDHASWQLAILLYFARHTEWKVRSLPELRVQVSASRYRVPDVTILKAEAPREQIITHAPLMVFEILSPEDTMKRILIKLADYQQMGIEGIFVIDPGRKTYVYETGNLEIVGGPVTVGNCQIDFDEIAALVS
jgi:Uma2 family endonuclease